MSRMQHHRADFLLSLFLALVVANCRPARSPAAPNPGGAISGGDTAGGNIATGGSTATGGDTATGGNTETGTSSSQNCGNTGQACCPGDQCLGSGVCSGGNCVACGSLGLPCCRGDPSCTDSSSQCSNGVCTQCGGVGESCCAGDSCTAGCCSAGLCVANASGDSCTTLPADAGSTPDTAQAGCTTATATPCTALPPFSGAQVLDGNDAEFCDVPSFELNFNNAASNGGRVVVYNSGTSNYPERAQARVAWDSFGIHAFIHVIDSKFVAATSADTIYNADAVELLFTSTTSGLSGGTAQDSGKAMHVILSPPLAVKSQASGVNGSQTPLAPSLFWAGTDSTGYTVELKLPWPGTPPTAGSQIKFDMEVNSADGKSTTGDAGPRDAQAILYQGSDPGNSPCGSPLYPYCDDRLWCSTTLQQ